MESERPMRCIVSETGKTIGTKQEDEELLIECTKRFKQAQDNVKSIVGTEWLEAFMELTASAHTRNRHRQEKTT